MSDICPKCGLPKELCVCDVLDKEVESRIKVYTKKAKFNKVVTIVEGLNSGDLENALKGLKRTLACGGTSKDSMIELQGDHKSKVKKILVNMGYKDTSIDVAS
ncbi:MAG: stress response translation initiation inhibitor YciH [Candidatus Marsarchaeota archaeon]|nr:stress response translation initiation inhibitor YciH [Candidatus Marsarchaeota archaeon]